MRKRHGQTDRPIDGPTDGRTHPHGKVESINHESFSESPWQSYSTTYKSLCSSEAKINYFMKYRKMACPKVYGLPKKRIWLNHLIGKKHGKVLSTLARACDAHAYTVNAYCHFGLA